MSGSITIVNAVIFDGESEERREGGVRIEGGAIVEVGDVSRGERVLDARGRTVVPGLIDAHFHAYAPTFDVMALDAAPLSYMAIAGAGRLASALRRGFTTVRDVAGGDIGLARGLAEGRVVGPRYLFSGGALSQTGGHGDPRHSLMVDCHVHGHMGEIVDGPDAVRKAVRERFRTGAHCIKVMASGGVASPTDPVHMVQFTPEELRAAVEEAERRDSYVAAHAYPPAAIRQAIDAGVRTIEHGNLLDESTAARMAQLGAILVPTLIAYDAMGRRGADVGMDASAREKNAIVLEAGKRAIELARRAGVTIGFGTDLMGELEDDQLLGLRLQIEVEGVLEVLRSATSINASILQRDDLGRVVEGATGDLVVLDGDPFEDAAVLWDESRPRTVVQAGTEVC